jgi:hypothetical protein
VHRLFKSQLYVAGTVMVDICIEMTMAKSDKHVGEGVNELFLNAFYHKTVASFLRCFKPKMYGLLFAQMVTVRTITDSRSHCEMPNLTSRSYPYRTIVEFLVCIQMRT